MRAITKNFELKKQYSKMEMENKLETEMPCQIGVFLSPFMILIYEIFVTYCFTSEKTMT